jgi:diguanylate cyclase (GGDEF)-like protein/PAS domain S-box-containing protein
LFRQKAGAEHGRTIALLPGSVLAAGLCVTLLVWLGAKAEARTRVDARLAIWQDRIAHAIEHRLDTNAQILRGVASLFAASRDVARDEFRLYMQGVDLWHNAPGTEVVGYAIPVQDAEKAAHVAAVRAEGFPDYAILPPGERPLYAPAVYLEPFSPGNRRAFGFDLASDPLRWEAASLARDSGRPVMSEMTALLRDVESRGEPGYLLFLPIYGAGEPVEILPERLRSFEGWVYAAFHMHALIAATLDLPDFRDIASLVAIAVYDGDNPAAGRLLYATRNRPGAALERGQPTLARTLTYGGQTWTMVIAAEPAFTALTTSDRPTLIALGGIAVSLLLAALVYVLLLGRRRVSAALGEAARANAKLSEREQDLLLAQRIAQLGSWTYEPATGRSHWSDGMFRIWGLEPEQGAAEGSFEQVRHLIYPEDRTLLETALRAAAERGRPYQIELRIRRTDGEERSVLAIGTPQCDAQGRVERVTGTVQDNTERNRLQQALREQAVRDQLTGLFNRRYLDETLPRELHRCERTGEPLTLAMLDVDHFKAFNDQHGHAAGDAVLREIGTFLGRSLRFGDIACRYGGEELTLILPGAEADIVAHRLDLLRGQISRLVVLCDGKPLPAVTVSIGIAQANRGDLNCVGLIKRADEALYEAKRRGRNQVRRATV